MTCETAAFSIADGASIVIATLAFLATVWQGWVARKHNRLSVTPMIVPHTDTNITDRGITLSFTIKNVGIGPALVTDRYFTVQGEIFKPKTPNHLLRELCESLIGRALNYQIISSGMIGKSGKIPAGSQINLITLFFPGLHPDGMTLIEALADKVQLVIEYKSIYGEGFVYKSNE